MTQTITQKQKEILQYLYQYRFLNRIQIQSFLNHQYHQRINDWLKDLREKEYVNRIYSTKFGENTKPAIYSLRLEGIRFLKTQTNCPSEILKKLYRDKDRSENFINQCLLIADIVLNLRNYGVQSKGKETELSYAAATAVNLANSANNFNFLAELNTDLLLKKETKKKTDNKTTISYFLFTIISPTLPRYSIRKRLKDFLGFYSEGEWADHEDKPFPAIMIVCPTLATLIYAKRRTRGLLKEEDNPEDLSIQFTTVDQIKKHGVTGEIWEKA